MTPGRKSRTRRSMLFVPGSNAAMLSNSFIYKADALMFDLEDSVTIREKIQRVVWCITHCNTRYIKILKPSCALTPSILLMGLLTSKPSFAVALILCAYRKPILRKILLILKTKFYALKKLWARRR